MTPTPDIAAVATKVFEELSKLDPEHRKRALRAALALLGDDVALAKPTTPANDPDNAPDLSSSGLGPRASLWLKQNKITEEQLSHVFHIDKGKVDLIATTSPGANKSQQAMNTYLLMGIKGLLESGEAKFDDKAAREACQERGCYDAPNHAPNLKTNRKNYLNGDKATGWSLTGPGQKVAADLIKSMAPA